MSENGQRIAGQNTFKTDLKMLQLTALDAVEVVLTSCGAGGGVGILRILD